MIYYVNFCMFIKHSRTVQLCPTFSPIDIHSSCRILDIPTPTKVGQLREELEKLNILPEAMELNQAPDSTWTGSL